MAARDEDLDLLKALRLLAFRSVEKPDHEYILRHICRWYSKAFHTPLAEVEAIPLETLLTHFFEVQAEEMSDEDREETRALLCETKPERLVREAKEAKEAVKDDDFEAMVREEAEEAKAKNAQPGSRKDEPIVFLPIMGSSLPTPFTDSSKGPFREIPPDIKMSFMSDSELEKLDEWDLLGPPKKDQG